MYANILWIKWLLNYCRCFLLVLIDMKLHASYGWWVWLKTHMWSFSIHLFVHIYTYNTTQHNIQHIWHKNGCTDVLNAQMYGCFRQWATALLSETFLLWFRVVWEIWPKSYISRHTLQSFSDTTLHVHVSRQIQSACNSTTLQSTPLLPRMILSVYI